jgi:hypothetical protein
MEEKIKMLKQLALDNYNNGGDGMVECWDNKDYEQFITRCEEQGKDIKETALKDMGVYDSHRKDIEATAF